MDPTKPILRLLFWESTIRCNLACAHCRRLESDEAASKDLATAQVMRLIDQLAALGAEQPAMPVMVFSGGEPLCREDLFDLLAHARGAGIPAALATNGTLVDVDVARRIADAGIARCSVSLDGATAEVHDRLRRLEGSFEQALAGIAHLRQAGVPFQINMTLTRHNAHQLQDVYELARRLGAVAVHIFMLVPVGCGQILGETDMLTPQEYEQKMLEICLLDGKGEIQMKVTCGPHYERVIRQQGLHRRRPISRVSDTPQPNHPHIPGRAGHQGPGRGCLAGMGVMFVNHEGEVYPCGYLPVRCGNILRTPLKDIWLDNPDLAAMRDSDGLEGKCGVCGYRTVCGGCRGRAYAATGNYMAEEPFCAYVPPQATD